MQDNVTIGSGAKLLGPITVGHGSKIGANSVVIHDVPPNSTVVGNPGHPVRIDGRRPEGPDADWVHLPDPIADAIKGLASRIGALERALAERGVDPATIPGDAPTTSRSRCGPRAARIPPAARDARTGARASRAPHRPASASVLVMFSRARTMYSGRPLTSS